MYYNFFRPHESLKDRTPAEVAGIKFAYKDWADVVRGKNKKPIQELEDGEDKSQIIVVRTRASPKRRVKRKKLLRSSNPVVPIFKEIRVLTYCTNPKH